LIRTSEKKNVSLESFMSFVLVSFKNKIVLKFNALFSRENMK